ncbi:hypothetical protein Tco_1483601 [Tanacetum coccineum]
MQKSEPSKKIKKRVQIQMTIDQELAKKLFEEEQASRDVEEEKGQKVLEESAKKTEIEQVEIERLDVASLATKYPIVDWETQIQGDKHKYQIKRANGSVKYYNLFSAMLYDFDRQDTMMEPNAEDEIWRNQEDWNLISWKLHNFCGVHVLLMQDGLVIHMLVERKYPLLQDILSKMLSRRLEVDYQSEIGYELIRFVKSQLQQ